MKNRSHRYDINRPRSRHGHEYSKSNTADVKNVSVWRSFFIKQYLSKIWSSIHEKVKQHWGWVET